MATLLRDYFEDGWRTRAIECACGWQGDSTAMVMQLHDDVTDYDCPSCEATLLIVAHPDLDQVRAAAAAGNVEAQQQLALVDEAMLLLRDR